MTRTLSALALASGVASASVASNQELLASKVDSANARRGLEVTGAIRGVAQASYFDTDQDPYGQMTMPDVERNEFVNADLNFGFRPWESVRANVMLRLYAGMQDYFASATKIMEVPWLNVEGQIGNNFYWVVGDFRQSYSPLTLFTPDVDILYEPQVFARKRHMAEKQQLLEGNKRNLQGANIQFRADLNDIFGEIRAEGLFARINRAQPLDLSGAEGNILPNETIPGATLASNMDKFVAAGNLELFPLKKTAYLGFTGMYIFDNEDSFTYTYRHPDNDPSAMNPVTDEAGYYEIAQINPYELDPQNTAIIAGRFGADVAGMFGNSSLILEATAELGLSQNREYIAQTSAAPDGTPVVNKVKEDNSGTALNVNLNAGFKSDSWKVLLDADFVYNDSAWFNNLAQSPKFFAQRIMNSDYDYNTVKFGVNSPLYSTFDALYHFAPKFSPVTPSLKTDDNGFKTQSESYNIAPYSKSSWGTSVYSKAQLNLINAMNDPAVQMILPNGLATSNREGIRANVTFSMSDWLEVQGLFGMFSQVNPDPALSLTAVDYLDFGGGLKVDVFKALGFSKPLEISGSYRHSERTMEYGQTLPNVTPLMVGSAEMKTDFINAGLYVQYLPRLGITAGFQMVTMEMNDVQQQTSVLQYAGIASIAPMVKGTQMQWMVGLDYSLEKNVWLSLNFGMISVENTYSNALGTAATAVNLPDYADKTLPEFTSEFSQTIVEASINVEF